MDNLNLAAITDQTPYVQKIKGTLEKATEQSIPLTEIKVATQRWCKCCPQLYFYLLVGNSSLYLPGQVQMCLKPH